MAENRDRRKLGRLRIPIRIERVSWRDLAATLGPVLAVSALALWAAFHFVRPAPPNTLAMASGPQGSTLHNYAERYRRILARSGVTLKIVPSGGTLDNLKKLADPSSGVEVGFVQSGLASAESTSGLVSLGAVGYVPLAIFYRSPHPLERLSQLRGKRIAVGQAGSGTRVLALALLKANEIAPNGETRLLDLGGDRAVAALLAHRVEAVFLSGDSASPANMRKLLHARGVRLFDFAQADAYVRRFPYLSKLELPPGALDLGRNEPPRTLTLIAPTLDLVARPELHPALSDLLVEAAREVHGRATLIQRAGEFPAPVAHEFPLSDDAARFYKSGKTFAYRYLPFWLASLADRIAVVLVPIIVVLIPGLRLVPTLYAWRIKTRIFRRYAELIALERAALSPSAASERGELLQRLDEIEKNVITMRLPASFADQLYVLRQHIGFVRARLAAGATASAGEAPPGT